MEIWQFILLGAVIIGLLAGLLVMFVKCINKDKDIIFVHNKTGNQYEIIGHCRMKKSGEWSDAIIYMSYTDFNLYVRDEEDFVLHFTPLKEWKKIK